jgi:hypothetical protein
VIALFRYQRSLLEGRVKVSSIKAALAVIASVVFFAAITGCKPADNGEKSFVSKVIPIKHDEPPKLPPNAQELVKHEFKDMDIDVSASSAAWTGHGTDKPGVDLGRAMLLNEAEITARGLDGRVSVIRSATALIDPAGKKVVFEGGVVAEGPYNNTLKGERIIWRYDRDEIEAVDGFTLENGRGITNGTRCVTDIGFSQIQVE